MLFERQVPCIGTNTRICEDPKRESLGIAYLQHRLFTSYRLMAQCVADVYCPYGLHLKPQCILLIRHGITANR